MLRNCNLASLLTAVILLLTASVSVADQLPPHRVLLVIGSQWQDDESFMLDVHQSEVPNYDLSFRPYGTEFFQLVVMLKSWGIPFDILQLDRERLTASRYLGSDGKPQYGCILFDSDLSWIDQADLESLESAVHDHGISLVLLTNSIRFDEDGECFGLAYRGYNMTAEQIEVSDGSHYLTRGLGHALVPVAVSGYVHRVLVEAGPGLRVLARHGRYPALTLQQVDERTSIVWIGGDRLLNFEHQPMRTLLRRAIINATGYGVYKTWENRHIIVMDDPGGAQCAWLDSWHYPTLTREQIRERLIKPLKQHNAMMVINVVPGFVNDSLRRVELTFQRDFVDKFGTRQNFISTGEGLRDGIREGVFEIQSHGWTHMQPDLESAPGPWWGAALDGEKAEVGWYREFGDTRRADPIYGIRPIPASTQTYHIRTGRDWLNRIFGIDPLSFVSGGLGVTLTPEAHTWKLAAREGFAWFCWHGGYLGPDIAVRGWLFEGTPESPKQIMAQPDAHDKGIAEFPEKFPDTFREAGPDAVYIGFNEYTGYMHAARQSRPLESATGIEWNYDPHYCQHFRENNSTWKLDFADWARTDLTGKSILVDGRAAGRVGKEGVQVFTVPAGIGKHRLEIR